MLVLCSFMAGCGGTSPVAQTSAGVVEEAPRPARMAEPVVASRQADVPAVTDPDEVIVYIHAGSVWMRKPGGSGEPQKLTTRSAHGPDQSPTLHAGGKLVAYVAAVDKAQRVHVMSLEDMQPRPLGDDSDSHGSRSIDAEPAWAPQGPRLAYMTGEPGERRDLVVRTLDTDTVEVVVQGNDDQPAHTGMPAWSPDGRTLALVADRREGKGALIWLVDTQTRRLRRLTSPEPGAPFLRDRDPHFSPDGQRIVFASNRHASSADHADDFDIYSIQIDGSGLTRLTQDPGVATDPVYSVDGKRIFFVSTRDSQRAYESEIYVMAASGGKQRRLTRDERPQNSAPWSARTK